MKIYKIYRLICLITNKDYIGKTVKSVIQRINEHINSKYLIGKAIRKHEMENFKIEILWVTTSKETANCIEKAAIDFYNSITPNGYNLKQGGEGGNIFSGKTKEEKIIICKKISKTLTGQKASIEAIEKNRKAKKGNQYHLGYKHTEKQKKKWSEDRIGNKNAKGNKQTKIGKIKTAIGRLKYWIAKLESS